VASFGAGNVGWEYGERPTSLGLSVAARSIETAGSIPVESVVMVCASSSTRSSCTIISTLPRQDGFHTIHSTGIGIDERWIRSSSLRVTSNGGGVKVYAGSVGVVRTGNIGKKNGPPILWYCLLRCNRSIEIAGRINPRRMDTECRRRRYREYLLFHGLSTVPRLLQGSYES